jgi:hypothetical protein
LGNFGTVALHVQASCTQFGQIPEDPVASVNVNSGASSQTLSYTVTDGHKDKCGDPSTITWNAWMVNNTQEPLDGAKIRISCASPGSSSNALLSPSGVIR